ncbi:MAG: outer membrane protein assembly factor BamB [Verrucomicrobiales bacterium]|jgi:outer membrane protein assembly factor BamB
MFRLETGLIALAALPHFLSGEDELHWPVFRGPDGLAVVADGKLPEAFGPETNVLWRREIPLGHSSPIILGNRIFLTAVEENELLLFAIDRDTGEVLWQQKTPREWEPDFAHNAVSPAMATPCTDGKSVYFYFGGSGVIATTPDGQVLWHRKLPSSKRAIFGTGASPALLDDGGLILQRDGGANSAILCLNTTDGSLRWKVDRPGFITSYASPYIWKNSVRTEIVVAGTNSLRGLSPENGRTIWEVGDTCIYPCSTPVSNGDRLFYAGWSTANVEGAERMRATFWGNLEITDEDAANPRGLFDRLDTDSSGALTLAELPESRIKDGFNYLDQNKNQRLDFAEFHEFHASDKWDGRNVMVAVDAGAKGDASRTHVAWEWTRNLPYVASPLAINDRVYIVKSGGFLTCLDSKTGELKYRTRLGTSGEYYATPLLVGGKIVICAKEGKVIILQDSDELKILTETKFDEEFFATPAFVNGTLYVRSDRALWAFSAQN